MPTPDAPPPIAGEGEGELPEGVTLDAGAEAEFADVATGGAEDASEAGDA
jgi:hypothetical protein